MSNCLSNSTVELNKMYIFIQQYSWIDKFYNKHQYRCTNSTVRVIHNIAFKTQILITIFESTWHHNWHLSVLAITYTFNIAFNSAVEAKHNFQLQFSSRLGIITGTCQYSHNANIMWDAVVL